MVRSVQRAIEIFQVKKGGAAIVQVTAPFAGGRQLAIQWAGILKEVLEAGATQEDVQTIKLWLKQDASHLWGRKPLYAVTGAEMLRSLELQRHAAD